LTVLVVSAVAVLAAVGFHYEFLLITAALVQHLPGPRRLRVAVAIVLIVGAHLIEVLVFGVGWWWCIRSSEPVLSLADPDIFDLFYFSGAVYTSLGFGDIVPVGNGRGLAVAEGVTGLVLIAWTASFTYFEMSANWAFEKREQP
jgi:hypothetical protein